MTSKIIAITGASSGIGLAIAEAFLQRGERVAFFVRSGKSLSYLMTSFPNQVFIFEGDVKILSDLDNFYQALHTHWQGLDVIIANAGVAIPSPSEKASEEIYDETFSVNVKGVFFTVLKARPYLKAGAAIILLSSIQQQRGSGIWSAYGASKAAVRSFARSFAEEFGPQGIRVNSLSPGVTQTPILKKMGFENLDQVIHSVEAETPLRRLGQADEIAHAALFLADNEFVTGADLQIDGGLGQI